MLFPFLTKFSHNGSMWSLSVEMHCSTHTQALCLLGWVAQCYVGFKGTRQSCNAVLAAFTCHSVFNLRRMWSEAPFTACTWKRDHERGHRLLLTWKRLFFMCVLLEAGAEARCSLSQTHGLRAFRGEGRSEKGCITNPRDSEWGGSAGECKLNFNEWQL